MPGFSCNACNAAFLDESEQKLHYRSEWHQYNLRRRVAGVPGITESLFNLRIEALEAEKKKLESENLLYMCSICDKEYRSEKAHAQHLQSKLHTQRALTLQISTDTPTTMTRPALNRLEQMGKALDEDKVQTRQVTGLPYNSNEDDGNQSNEEWELVEEDRMSEELGLGSNSKQNSPFPDIQDSDEWNAAQCFLCDLNSDGTVEGCVEHMHKMHGFFIPDSEYLKDPRGLLNYLGLKVTKGFMCLYCDDRGKRFQSLEAVRKHMTSKSHCKLRYEDGYEDLEELEEFYDFSSSYVNGDGTQIMAVDEIVAPVALSGCGSELAIRYDTENGSRVKILGAREFFRYYKQRPRPSDPQNKALVNAVVARYRSMGLVTRQSEMRITRGKERIRNFPSVRLERMRTKVGMKNNVIRNLPKNVPF